MRFISYTQYLWLDLHQSIAGSGCLSGEACGCEQRGDLECGWVGETLWYTSWPHFLPHVVVWYIASLFVCVCACACVGYMALVPLHDNNDTLYHTKKHLRSTGNEDTGLCEAHLIKHIEMHVFWMTARALLVWYRRERETVFSPYKVWQQEQCLQFLRYIWWHNPAIENNII